MDRKAKAGSDIHNVSTQCSLMYEDSTSYTSRLLKKKCDKNFKFENWRKKNKGMNKQQQPDPGIPDTSIHCSCVYQASTS